MQRRQLTVLILILCGLLVWLALWQPAIETQQCEQADAPMITSPGGGFTLDSFQGPVRLADFTGQVVLLYFGYTWCPDICPTSLGLISLALDTLSVRERARVQSLFISVDPQRDSPERLREYTEYFHPKILGLTGSPEEVARVAGQYGAAYRRVAAEPGSQSGYAVDHSAYTYLIDTRGVLVERIPHGTMPAEMTALIRRYLDSVPD